MTPNPASRRPVRLVATDMDGTLLSPAGTVSRRTAAAVRTAREAGLLVVPVTGRPPQALWALAGAAGLGPIGVCSNGAVVVDLDSGELVEVDHLPGALAASLVHRARRAAPGVRFAIDGLERFSHEAAFFDEPIEWDEQVVVVDDLTPVLEAGCIKLIARLPGTSAQELMARLAPVLEPDAHVTTSGLDWVDIGVLGVTKATALARVCRRLGIDPDEVVAIGDNHNDLSMLEWAGTAAAIGNAVAEVLAAADVVLATNAEDGVARLLEELAAAG